MEKIGSVDPTTTLLYWTDWNGLSLLMAVAEWSTDGQAGGTDTGENWFPDGAKYLHK